MRRSQPVVVAMRLLAMSAMQTRCLALRAAPRAVYAATRGRSMAMQAVEDVAKAVPTLDERLIADNPELMKSTLRMRRSPAEQLVAVDRIGELTRMRAAAVMEGNEAREARKKLSQNIGQLMKAGKTEEAEAVKAEVAASAAVADSADERLQAFDAERAELFNTLPNLLDPRTVDGDDEESNVEVSSWGCEGELPTERLWHDEFATNLNGLDLEGAATLSGSRFAVLRGGLARLERALINFFVDMHTEEHGVRARVGGMSVCMPRVHVLRWEDSPVHGLHASAIGLGAHPGACTGCSSQSQAAARSTQS